MNRSKIPVRYAKAFFLFAKGKKMLSALSEDVRLLSGFFEANPSLIHWLRSPVIKMDDKKELFRKQFEGTLSPMTFKFIDHLIERKRESFFPDILRNITQFHKADAGIKTIIMTTATEVDDSVRQKLSLKFSKKNRAGHEIITRVKPSLIGGFMLQIDDLLYDASLATEMKSLKKELTGQLKSGLVKKDS